MHSVTKVGRISSAQLLLDDPSVSRIHAIIEAPDTIIDLGSATGTLINGVKRNKSQLQLGDRIQIGVFTLEVATPDESWRATPIHLTANGILDPEKPAPEPRVLLQPVVTPKSPWTELPPQLAYLEALPKQREHVPASTTRSVPERIAVADILSKISADDRELVEQVGMMIVVGIDKLREHRGDTDEAGKAYTTMLECMAKIRVPRAAPSLLLELAHGMPELEDDWRATFAASIAQHDAVWPHLFALADLPGFARNCAIAAVAAGRDPLPWLAHPFGEVRAVAAQVIRDPDERRRACASVWASYAASDMKPRFDWRAAYEAETEPLHDLPPIGQLVDGLFADCADQRAWTIERVAHRRSPADAHALAVADELDAARACAGWPRTRVDWVLWHGVPLSTGDRVEWIREQARTRPSDLTQVVLAQLTYAQRGYEPPKLVLSEDAYEAVLDQERCEALAALQELEQLGHELERSKVAANAATG
ncbi:MAG: FHA domain-containing protein [Myxococcota bacterium]|nr:FHA domain-containing protein [Myxococcota bacterium]